MFICKEKLSLEMKSHSQGFFQLRMLVQLGMNISVCEARAENISTCYGLRFLPGKIA